MDPSKMASFTPGTHFQLTKGGRLYKVVDTKEQDGGVVLDFVSVHKVGKGYLKGKLSLKLITHLHHASP